MRSVTPSLCITFIVLQSLIGNDAFLQKFPALKHGGQQLREVCREIRRGQSSTHVQLGLSLDVPAVPSTQIHFKHASSVLFASLIFISFILLKSIFDTFSASKYSPSFFSDLLPSLRLGWRVFCAKVGLFMERVNDMLDEILYRKKAIPINLDKWNVCTLKEKEYLPGNFVKYRLSLPNPDSVVYLYPGQEVTLCITDNLDTVVKESFLPISTNRVRGYFDILSRKDVDAVTEDEKFTEAFEAMEIGDELGFKGGDYRLKFGGLQADQIKGITLIGSSLGIAPALQILRGMLSMDDITVENIEFVWLNEDRKDFVLENEIEQLELQYFEKFSTTKILEKGLFGRDLTRNSMIDECTTSYQPGRLGIICAPDYHTAMITQFLVSHKKYPVQNIAVIDTPV